MSTTVESPRELLARFRLEAFRPGQEEVVQAVLAGHDVLCVMPTGGGKSLCYQLPSLAREGTTIVISPLIALMKDQVDALQRLGIAADLINSGMAAGEQESVMRRMAEGKLDLVYVAPERLRNNRFLEAVRSARVSLLAVDEAHCVSEWGHDFRPDYARLGLFREKDLGGVQTIALTATATPTVRDDVAALLRLRDPQRFVTGFARSNLRFVVDACKSDREKDGRLTAYLQRQEGCGIIYAATRKRCEELAEWLPVKLRRRVGVYHAGLEPAQRQSIQEAFMRGELAAIVATNAFGMGIDKADLRFVVHYNMPGSLEAYYQEAGRAGRDGLPAECLLLFSYNDRHIQEFFIENRYPTEAVVRQVYRFLLERSEDPIELTLQQVRDGVDMKVSTEAISTAETLLAKAGVLKRLDSSANHALVRIDSTLPTLLDLLPREAKLRRRVMRAVEKVVGRRRGEDVYVRPQRLQELAEVDREQLSRTLRELSGLQAFDYVPPFRGRAIHLLRHDVPFEQLRIDFEELARRKAADFEKLESVIGFARAPRCRQRQILVYFGDPSADDCGCCDRCAPGGAAAAGSGEAGSGQAGEASGSLAALSTAAAGSAPPVAPEALTRGIQIVLSGVARTHGRFGKTIVAQMLTGSQNKTIQQRKLNRLSTYALLGAMRQSEVVSVLDALLDIGLVEQVEVEQRRPTVQLTELGREAMHGREPLPLALRLPYPLARRLAAAARGHEASEVSGGGEAAGAGGSPEAGTGEPAMSAADAELLARLRSWRRRTAAASGLPAFRILSNATLERIARDRPGSAEQLESIKGIGPATLEQFGYDLLELIAQGGPQESSPHAPREETLGSPAPRGEAPKRAGEARPPAAAAADSFSQPGSPDAAFRATAAYWTWRLLNDGYAVAEVLEIRQLSWDRLAADLRVAAEAGCPLREGWLAPGSLDEATGEA